MIRAKGWEQRLARESAIQLWPAVAGPEVARHAAAVALRGRVLLVSVVSGAWATQLGYLKADLLRRLRSAGAESLADIVFRVDPGQMRAAPPAPGPQRPSAPLPAEALRRAEQLRAMVVTDGNLSERLGSLFLAAAARTAALQASAAAEPPPRPRPAAAEPDGAP
jgi:hypothetical protein